MAQTLKIGYIWGVIFFAGGVAGVITFFFTQKELGSGIVGMIGGVVLAILEKLGRLPLKGKDPLLAMVIWHCFFTGLFLMYFFGALEYDYFSSQWCIMGFSALATGLYTAILRWRLKRNKKPAS